MIPPFIPWKRWVGEVGDGKEGNREWLVGYREECPDRPGLEVNGRIEKVVLAG